MTHTGNIRHKEEDIIIEFINHSSFLVESPSSLLIVDPWVEGSVFVGGWRLLDQTTNNEKLLKRALKGQSKGKDIYLYYTHEHPDHFSVSFLKSIATKTKFEVICNNITAGSIGKYCMKQKIKTNTIAEGERKN